MTTHSSASVIFTLAGVVLAVSGLTTAQASNPVQTGRQAVSQGESLFKDFCANCHGVSAKGDGPIAELFRKPLPDLTQIAIRNNGRFPTELMFRIIDGREPVKGHGGPIMPVWGEAFGRMKGGSDEETVRQDLEGFPDFH